jgi:hypothetical protein
MNKENKAQKKKRKEKKPTVRRRQNRVMVRTFIFFPVGVHLEGATYISSYNES